MWSELPSLPPPHQLELLSVPLGNKPLSSLSTPSTSDSSPLLGGWQDGWLEPAACEFVLPTWRAQEALVPRYDESSV